MLQKLIKSIIAILLLGALAIGGYYYFQHKKVYPSTDDAYVQAHVVYISPRITGMIKNVYVQNHQKVDKGQLLFEIDPAPFQIALNKAQANLTNTMQQVEAEKSAVKASQALVAERKADLTNARKNYMRIMSLLKTHLYAISQGDTATRQLKVNEAALSAAKNQLREAQEKLGSPGKQNAQIREAKAEVAEAKLNLSYTKVYAPGSGYIVKFTLRKGSEVTAYSELFAIVESNTWWVTANFKETDLERIRRGQHAKISIDMYPGVKFSGVVQYISAGAGSSFSLLPPENASGNWVKVTQRFPVKIKITSRYPQYPLRLGASSTVTINTTK